MAANPAGKLVRYIRDLAEAEATKGLTDGQLLALFVQQRAEAAFAGLVKRHGRLVWSVCRHLLGTEQDAEDAFQATFLILARRPTSIRKAEAVGSWLHGVAYRVALKAMKKKRKRQMHERAAAAPALSPTSDLALRELQAILDEEVRRLPEKYRAPFLLCCLEGRTRAEASKELACNEGTVSSRIARARRLLQARLTGRGVTLAAALCAGDLWTNLAAASLPTALAANTIKAACGAAVGTGFAGASAGAMVLADGVVRAMTLAKWQVGVVIFLAVSLTVTTAALSGRQTPTAPAPDAKPANVPTIVVKKDLYGDALPQGALARLGTVRQRAPASRLAVTADGKEVLAVSENLTIRRFDALTGQLRATQHLPSDSDRGVRSWVSPNGTFVLASDFKPADNQQLDLWELAQGKRTRTLSVGQGLTRQVAFSPAERLVAIVIEAPAQNVSCQIVVWDLKTSKSKVLWSENRERANGPYTGPALAVSPDGKLLAANFPDKILRCWDIQRDELLWESTTSGSSALFFSPDARAVVCAIESKEAGLKRWNSRTGKPIEVKNPPPKEAVHLIGFVPGGAYLAFETALEEVMLWDPDTAKVALRLPAPHSWGSSWRTSLAKYAYVFTPDGKGLIRRAGALQRWDLTTGKAVYADTENWGHTAAVLRLVFSPDGTRLASSSVDQTARVWAVATARPLHVFPKDKTHHLAFTPDGRFLFVRPLGIDEVGLRQWDLATGRAKQDYKFPDHPGPHPITYSKELRITSDAKKILMTNARWENGYETWLTTWEALSAKCLDHKKVEWTMDSVVTADGNAVVALDAKTGAVAILDVTTGKPRLQFATDRSALDRPVGCDLTLSPSGRLMAARAYFIGKGRIIDDDVRIGDMSTGRQIAKLLIPRPVVNQKNAGDCFAFTADDRIFAAIIADGVGLWETASWQAIGSIKDTSASPAGRIFSIAFSPDGRTLATGHADSTILLWDATLSPGAAGRTLTVAGAEALWTDLGGADAKRAYAAVWRLVDDSNQAVSLLKDRLKPISAAPPQMMQALLHNLDSNQFQQRDAAKQKLQVLGEVAEPALRMAMKGNPSLELRRRLEALLERLHPAAPLNGAALRGVRAVQVLERIGTPEARSILAGLGQGLASARLTRAAKEALARMEKR